MKITCPHCDGSGANRVGPASRFDDSHPGVQGCDFCGGGGFNPDYSGSFKNRDPLRKGRGYIEREVIRSDRRCEDCGGDGKVNVITHRSGKTFFGNPFTEEVRSRRSCEDCLGTGRQCEIVVHDRCEGCKGHGEIRRGRQETSFFGNRRTVYRLEKCDECHGKGSLARRVSVKNWLRYPQ